MAMKKLLVLGLASSLFVSSALITHPFSDSMINVSAQQLPSRKVSLGATLNANDVQRTLQLLNATDVTLANQITIDGPRVNAYLNDGSTASTNVYSSAIIEPREAGYGVQVQIVTPQTIQNVSAQTYQNAAITSGAKDVLIKIASVYPVTGEGALAGVYAIYQANGNKLNQQNINVAQKEIKLPAQVKEKDKLTDAQINLLTANIKSLISKKVQQDGQITDDQIKAIIKEQADALEKQYNVSVSEESRSVIFNLMKEFAALEIKNYDDTLADSNQESWTMQQALDLLAGATYSPYKLTESPTMPENDALEWEEVSRENNVTVLKFGDVYYTFTKFDTTTFIAASMDNEGDDGYFIEDFEVDHNTLYTLTYINFRLMDEYGALQNVDQAINYLDQALYPSTIIEGYKLVATDSVNGFWDISPMYLDENDQETPMGVFRVWLGGYIEFLTHQEMAGYDVQYVSDPVEDTTVEETTLGETTVEDTTVQDTTVEDTTVQETTVETTEVVQAEYWNAEKDLALEEFMKTWGQAMNQEYQKRTPEQPGNMYGVSFPDEVFNYIGVVDEQVKAYWSTDGISLGYGDYAVVAAYEDSEHYFTVNPEAPAGAHFYLFAIVNGQPIVLHSQQNQGNAEGLLYFNPSENVALQEGFANIVNQ